MLEKLGVDSNSIQPWPSVVLEDPYLTLGESAPGTPPQTTPDYVLNPLSIFRMARNDIAERHAPENRFTPRDDSAALSNTTCTDGEPNIPGIALDSTGTNNIYDPTDPLPLNLDMFFKPDLAWDWQPAETIVGSGMEGEELLPWVGSSQFDFSYLEPGK